MKIYFHYQDLNDYPKKYLVYGRCWIGHKQLHLSWRIPAWHEWDAGIELNHYGDTAIGFHISLGLFSFHICTENRWLYRKLESITKRKDQKYTNGRTIGVSFFSNALWVDLWNDPMEHRGKDPHWWHFSIHFDDILLGKRKYSKEILESGSYEIDMPEGAYPCTYEIATETWTRPRWFSKVQKSIYFDIPAGIPEEGKGENSWDIGMDAVFGTGTYYNGDLHEAAKRVALNCLKSRAKYGSLKSPDYGKWRTERIAS